MMVTGLQLPFQSLPVDGMSAKSQPIESETSQSLSFGEILKVKEKQLQKEQEISVSSIAASLANLQTLPTAPTLPMPEIESSNTIEKVDTQAAVQTNVSESISSQIGTPVSTNGSVQASLNILVKTDQAVSRRLIPTELPSSVSDKPQTFSFESLKTHVPSALVDRSQLPVTKLSESNTTILSIDQDAGNQVLQRATKLVATVNATPNRSPLEIPSKQTVVTEPVEPQISTARSDSEPSNSMTFVGSKAENLAIPPSPQMSESAKVATPSLAADSFSLDVSDQSGKPKNVVVTTLEIPGETSVSEFSTSKDLGEIPLNSLQPEKSVDTAVSKDDAAHTIPAPSLSFQDEFEQKTVSSLFEPSQKRMDTSVPSFEPSDEMTTAPLSDQAVTNPAIINFTSRADESLTDTSPFSDITFAPSSHVQTSAPQGVVHFTFEQDNLTNTNTSTIEAQKLSAAQPSTVQTQINFDQHSEAQSLFSQGTVAPASEPVEVPEDVSTYSSFTKSGTDQKSIQFTSYQANELNLTFAQPLTTHAEVKHDPDLLRAQPSESLVNTWSTTLQTPDTAPVQTSSPTTAKTDSNKILAQALSPAEAFTTGAVPSKNEALLSYPEAGPDDSATNARIGAFQADERTTAPKTTNVISQQNIEKTLISDKEIISSTSSVASKPDTLFTPPAIDSETREMNMPQGMIDGQASRTLGENEVSVPIQNGQIKNPKLDPTISQLESQSNIDDKQTAQASAKPLNTENATFAEAMADSAENAASNESMFVTGNGQDVELQHGETSVSRPSISQTNVGDSTITSVDETDETMVAKLKTPVTDARQPITVDSSALDVRNVPINTDWKVLTVKANLAKPQTDSTISFSEAAIELSPTVKETLNANANPIEVQSKASLKEQEPSNNWIQPLTETMQPHAQANQQTITALKTNQSNADIETSIENSQPKFEFLDDVKDSVTKRTETQLSEATSQPTPRSANMAAAVPEPSSSTAKTELRIEHEGITSQQDGSQDVSPQSPDNGLTTQPQTNQEELSFESRATRAIPVGPINTPQVDPYLENLIATPIPSADLQKAMAANAQPVKSTLDMIETHHLEELVNLHVDSDIATSRKEQISQTNSMDATNRVDVTYSEKDSHTPATPTQSMVPQETYQAEVAPQPSSPFSGISEPEINEKQVKVSAPSIETLRSDPSAGLEMGFEMTTNAELQKKLMLSTKTESLDEIPSGFPNVSKPIPSQAPDLISHGDEVVDAQPGISVKTEAGKQILKNNPVVSKDEKIRLTEKHVQPNQSLESAGSSAGAVKEPMIVGQTIKIPTNQVNTQPADVAQQVIHQMNLKIKNAPASMHLQLSPKELGNIDVEMVSTSQGVRVTFFVEQTDTGKLLATQLSQLRESLIDSGVQLSSLNISQQGLSEQKGGFFSQEKSFTQYPQGDIPRQEVNSQEELPTQRVSGSSGEVDYRI